MIAAASTEIAYRPASADDLEGIMDLERSTLAEWSRQSWAGELGSGDRDVLVASMITAGPILGVITVQTVERVADLHRLLVAPDHRRVGIGTELVRRGVAAARRRGARFMMLEVAWDNDAAIALYARQGFEQLGIRSNYYGPGRDALIMKRYELTETAPNGQEEFR